MKLAYISAAALLISAGAAIAQSAQKAPGGNLPAGQGPCARGYEAAVQDGRMAGISSETMRSADTDSDGRLSKTEFDAACAKKLFEQQQQKN
jgi:hypothetical protein